MIGRVFRATERDPSQLGNDDYMFEQLLASSQKKKKKSTKQPASELEKKKAEKTEKVDKTEAD